MMTRRRQGLLRLLPVALTLTLATPTLVEPAPAGDPIIEFTEHPGELDSTLAGPTLRIYDDGRVVVTRPPYMHRPGTHSRRLSPTELTTLLQILTTENLRAFDGEEVLRARRESRQQKERGTARAPLQYSSDRETIELRILVEDPQARAAATETSIRWSGLRADRRLQPDRPEIQSLANAVDALRALRDGPDFTEDGTR